MIARCFRLWPHELDEDHRELLTFTTHTWKQSEDCIHGAAQSRIPLRTAHQANLELLCSLSPRRRGLLAHIMAFRSTDTPLGPVSTGFHFIPMLEVGCLNLQSTTFNLTFGLLCHPEKQAKDCVNVGKYFFLVGN